MTNIQKALELIHTFASGDTEKAKSLLADGMPIPDVARHTGLAREVVEELAAKKDK